MTIEFLCSQCGQKLSTPDESAGKKARCPACGAISAIPTPTVFSPPPEPEKASSGLPHNWPPGYPGANPTSLPSASRPIPASQPGAANPFADFSAASAGNPARYSENPYASTSAVGFTPAPVAFSGELVATKIYFGDVFGATWNVFSKEMGQCALMGLVVMGIWIGTAIVSYVAILLFVGVTILLAGGANRGEPPAAVFFLIVPLFLFGYLAMIFGMCYLMAGMIRFTLGLARGISPPLGLLFSGWRYSLRFLLLSLVLGILSGFIFFLFMMPGLVMDAEALAVGGYFVGMLVSYYFMFAFSVAAPLIVDRDVGVGEALSGALRYSRGNRLTIFLLFLAAGLLGSVAYLFTCGMGMILVFPFWILLLSVIYLKSTGQPVVN